MMKETLASLALGILFAAGEHPRHSKAGRFPPNINASNYPLSIHN